MIFLQSLTLGMVFSTRARDAVTTSIREGTHLATNEYVSILSFDENILTVSEIPLTDIIG